MAENKVTHSDAAVGTLKANLGFFDSKLPAVMESHLISLLDKAFADFARGTDPRYSGTCGARSPAGAVQCNRYLLRAQPAIRGVS